MQKKIRMNDIASKLSVSIVTVSKALSDKEGVSDTLREQIKKTAEEMGYKYTKGCKIIDSENTYNIGVVVAEAFMENNNSFYWDVYQNIVKALSELNYYALLEIISPEAEEVCTLSILVDRKVDGLIMLGQVHRTYIDYIYDQEIPMICLDFYDKHFEIDSVITDNMYGGYTLTSYLLNQGHTKIGFVGNIHHTSSILDRYLGYCKALLEDKIDLNPMWLLNPIDNRGEFCQFTLPDELPTAFVCNCDEVAYHFIKFLNSKGIRVPEDISIVGFDDYIYATLSTPQITTVQIDVQNMASTTVEAIIRKIRDADYSLGRKVIPNKVILRDSVKNFNS